MSFLIRVCESLNAENLRFAVVGGHAVALHGAVRGTVDIDVALRWRLGDLVKAERAVTKLGLKSRLPLIAKDVFDFRDEYIKNRNLVAWNFYNPSDLTEQLDIIITYDLTGKRINQIAVDETNVPILNIVDLIEMKKESGRPQDIEDVMALEQLR